MARIFASPLSRRAVLAGAAFATLAVLPAVAALGAFQPYKKAAFETALKGDKPVLVHVHAEWCPTCKKQEQVFDELSKSGGFAKVTAIRVDFDAETEFKKTYGVNNQSVLLVFKGGKEVARSGGVTDSAKLTEFVAAASK